MKYKTDFYKSNYFEDFTDGSPKKEAVVFIHGFPGRREDKNRDLVTSGPGYDIFLMHHKGLGKSRDKFSFSESVESTHQFYDFIRGKGYAKVHVVGHSWGGFVSLSMMEKLAETSSKMILLSPFLRIPSGEKLKAIAKSLHTNSHEFVGHFSQDEIEADLYALSQKHNFEHYQQRIHTVKPDVLLIQALNDDETPVETAREFMKEVPEVKYLELDTDHAFENCRAQIKDMIHSTLTAADGKR